MRTVSLTTLSSVQQVPISDAASSAYTPDSGATARSSVRPEQVTPPPECRASILIYSCVRAGFEQAVSCQCSHLDVPPHSVASAVVPSVRRVRAQPVMPCVCPYRAVCNLKSPAVLETVQGSCATCGRGTVGPQLPRTGTCGYWYGSRVATYWLPCTTLLRALESSMCS